MKKLFYLSLCIPLSIFIASCSSDNSDSESAEETKSVTEDLKSASVDCNCKDAEAQSPTFSGSCEELWGDNSRKEYREYSNGMKHGLLVSWDEKGVLRRRLNFANDKQDGEQLAWDEKGVLIDKSYREKDDWIKYKWKINTEDNTLKVYEHFGDKAVGKYENFLQITKNNDGYYAITYDMRKTNDEVDKALLSEIIGTIKELNVPKLNIGSVHVQTNKSVSEQDGFKKEIVNYLIDKHPDVVVLDEGNKHLDFM